VPYDHLAPTTPEDEAADEVVRRGRNVGATWIIGSILALWLCLVATAWPTGLLALTASAVLLAIGLRVRARYWQDARRQLGDATLQRARWRGASEDRGSRDRIMIAIALVMVLFVFQAWRR